MSEFSIELDVRWGDMDAFGHVNNAAYLSYLEQVRTLWLKHVGCGLNDFDSGPVVANINLNYRQVLNWPERLKVTLRPESPGRSSMKLHSEILAVAEEKGARPMLYADGTVTIVWIDKKTGESVPLPSAIRQQAADD
ncbi:MAG: thioesterase family protein [Pseudomonadota bacterium]